MGKPKSKSPKKTRKFGGKKYRLAKEHNLSKRQAKRTAKAFREKSSGSVKARVAKSGGKHHVYTRSA